MRGRRVAMVMVVMACKSPQAAFDAGVTNADAIELTDAMDAADAMTIDASSAALAIVSDYDDFGSTVIGLTSVPINVTVTNTGGITSGALVTSIQSTPTQFAISADSCNGVALAAGASCAFQVRFIPIVAGIATAAVRVDDNAVSAMKTLYGTAVYPHEYKVVNPTLNDFGSVAIGSTTASRTFTVTNNGAMTHGPISLALQGANPAAFSIVDDACTNVQLAAGATCTFGVTFTPNASGTATAHVMLASIGGDVTVGVRGIGLDPKLRIDLP